MHKEERIKDQDALLPSSYVRKIPRRERVQGSRQLRGISMWNLVQHHSTGRSRKLKGQTRSTLKTASPNTSPAK